MSQKEDDIENSRRKKTQEERTEPEFNPWLLPKERIGKDGQDGEANLEPEVSPRPPKSNCPAAEGQKDRAPDHRGTVFFRIRAAMRSTPNTVISGQGDVPEIILFFEDGTFVPKLLCLLLAPVLRASSQQRSRFTGFSGFPLSRE